MNKGHEQSIKISLSVFATSAVSLYVFPDTIWPMAASSFFSHILSILLSTFLLT